LGTKSIIPFIVNLPIPYQSIIVLATKEVPAKTGIVITIITVAAAIIIISIKKWTSKTSGPSSHSDYISLKILLFIIGEEIIYI